MYHNHNLYWMIGINITFFIVTIVLIMWFIRTPGNRRSVDEIIRQRYATGEITKKQYSDMIKTLETAR